MSSCQNFQSGSLLFWTWNACVVLHQKTELCARTILWLWSCWANCCLSFFVVFKRDFFRVFLKFWTNEVCFPFSTAQLRKLGKTRFVIWWFDVTNCQLIRCWFFMLTFDIIDWTLHYFLSIFLPALIEQVSSTFFIITWKSKSGWRGWKFLVYYTVKTL